MSQVRQVALVSVIAPGMSRAEERQIVGIAKRNNRRAAMTGLLVSSGTHFLQVLEGPSSSLDDLLPKIAIDLRHSAVRVLFDRVIMARRYESWSMGYLYSLGVAEELSELHSGALTTDADALLSAFETDGLGDAVYGRPTSVGARRAADNA